MNRYKTCPCELSAIRHLLRLHYLGKPPGVTVSNYALVDECKGLVSGIIGCCVFALPPPEIAARFDVRTAWELARLFILDETPKNTETWFISRCIRDVREKHPEVELLVSYADPSAGHSGVIYRAGNWIDDGNTDQERRSPRFDYTSKYETLFGTFQKKYSRSSHVPENISVERLPRISKHRFVYWMRDHEQKRQAAR